MSKRASSILMLIFEILAVALIIFSAVQAATKMAKSETVTKINLANDLKMMINTFLQTEGDIIVSYPYNVSKFTLNLNSREVRVLVQGENEINQVKRDIHLPEGYQASGFIEQKEKICLEKKNKNIFLRECKSEEK